MSIIWFNSWIHDICFEHIRLDIGFQFSKIGYLDLEFDLGIMIMNILDMIGKNNNQKAKNLGLMTDFRMQIMGRNHKDSLDKSFNN